MVTLDKNPIFVPKVFKPSFISYPRRIQNPACNNQDFISYFEEFETRPVIIRNRTVIFFNGYSVYACLGNLTCVFYSYPIALPVHIYRLLKISWTGFYFI